jgi:hypothetical protein
MGAIALGRVRVRALGGFVACAVLAAALAWASVEANHSRACALRESPVAESCTYPPAGSAAEIQSLRERIRRNPGDSNAYAELALAYRGAGKQELVKVASRLAPRDPRLLLYRAAFAVDRGAWKEAAAHLVELVERHDVPAAIDALAQLIANGQGAVLEPYLTAGSRWFPPVLVRMREAGGRVTPALPLVTTAFNLGIVDLATVRSYVRELKTMQAWADAYGLWLSIHGRSMPALFNGSFDNDFEPDGFDWEVPEAGPNHRRGVVVEQRRMDQRGGVLELELTGREITQPIVRQDLFIGPGTYRLRGEYLTRHLRADDGFGWAIRCRGAVAGKARPLAETGGIWQSMAFEFTVPANCGLVVTLQFEALTTVQAISGARGRIALDSLTLEKSAQ